MYIYMYISISHIYDTEIPGVRCVDAEEVENGDVAMGALDPFLSIEEEPSAFSKRQPAD